MTEDLTRGQTEDAGAELKSAETQSFTGAEGAEQLIGQGSVMVGRPGPGETVEISAEPGSTYVLDFDPSEARAVVEGDNLILVFEDGAQIVFENLVSLAQLENGPSLQYAGEDMIALLQAQGILPGVLEGFELTQPEPGQVLEIQAALGQRFIVNFDPAIAQVAVDGDNLVLTFPNGGQIIIVGLGGLTDQPGAPVFNIAGNDIAGGTLMGTAVALAEGEAGPEAAATLETAAGGEGPVGTGATQYSDDLGNIIDTVAAQGVIPPVELEFGVPDLEVVDIIVEENQPPQADPVLTPADSDGEIPSDVLAALDLTSGDSGGGATTAVTALAADTFGVTTSNDGEALVNAILGSGITIVGPVTYTGSATSSGFFEGGLVAGIGIESGIILTSGDANSAVGPNDSDGTSTSTGTGGDADLDALIPQSTNDVSSLEFTFISDGGDLFFNFVFASEEYNEYVNSSFNDVFAFFLDGENIALIPGTNTAVSINNVNLDSNSEYYNNNDLSDGGPFFNIEYDGFTNVLTVSVTGLEPGEHTIKLAVADAGDTILDSAVFIEAGSFSDVPPGTDTSDIAFFKELTVTGEIGDNDNFFGPVDMGGADNETPLELLTFTLLSQPQFGTLVLDPGDGSTPTVMSVGDTFTSEDTVWWIATEEQVSDFLAENQLEQLPDVTFDYSVTDADGASAAAPVVITFPEIPPPVAFVQVGPETDQLCVEEDSADNVVDLSASATDGVLTTIVISGLDSTWGYDLTGLEVLGVTSGDITNNIAGDGTVTIDLTGLNLLSYDASFAVTPPPDSDVDLGTITATADAVSDINPVLTDSDSDNADIVVDANADAPTVDITVSDSGDSGTTWQSGETGSVTVTATFGDDADGSETHTVVVDVPSGFTASSVSGGGVYDSTAGTVTWTVPTDGSATDTFTGTFDTTNTLTGDTSVTFSATATATETTTGDVECDTSASDNTATATDSEVETIANVGPPTVSLALPGGVSCLEEDSLTSATENEVTITATASAGDELTTIVITGFDAGTVEGSGASTTWLLDIDALTTGNTDVSSASYDAGTDTLTIVLADDVTTFTGTFDLAPPADSDVDMGTLTATATAADSTDPNVTATSTGALAVNVDANADAPTVDITVSDSGDADTFFESGETGSVTVTATFGDDADGSETHTVVVDVPSGFTVETGTISDSGVYDSTAGTVTWTVPTDGSATDTFTGTFDTVNSQSGILTSTFSATATATETTTGDVECDTSASDNTATAVDSFDVAVEDVELLNFSSIANTNSGGQRAILTFYDNTSILTAAYSAYIIFVAEGQEQAQALDTGFAILPGTDFTYGLEAHEDNDSKINMDELFLEGVDTTEPKNITQLAPSTEASGSSMFGFTGVIDPSNGEGQVGTESEDGGTGADSVTDPNGSLVNLIYGGSGADTLTGDTGSDSESDILNGGAGTDSITGGSGNDIIAYDPGDTIDGGAGDDLIRVDSIGDGLTTFNSGGVTYVQIFNQVVDFDSSGISNMEGILITDQPVLKPGDEIDGTALLLADDTNGDGIVSEDESTAVQDLGVQINLEISDVLAITDADDELYIMGSDGDLINLQDDLADGIDWELESINGDFATYTYGTEATVHIEVGTFDDASIDVELDGTASITNGVAV